MAHLINAILVLDDIPDVFNGMRKEHESKKLLIIFCLPMFNFLATRHSFVKFVQSIVQDAKSIIIFQMVTIMISTTKK